MLSVDQISNNKEETLIGLKKRGFKDFKIIDKIIDLNLSRKKIQQELDQILFESNNISKKISEIFKSGNNDDSVSTLKEKSSDLKLKSKNLSDQLEKTKSDIFELLTTIPNIPDNEVPEGLSIDDNIIFIILNFFIKIFKFIQIFIKPYFVSINFNTRIFINFPITYFNIIK